MRGVLQAAAACVPMYLCVAALQAVQQQSGPFPARWTLVPEVLAGAAGYALGAHLFARATTTDLLGLCRQMIRRRTVA